MWRRSAKIKMKIEPYLKTNNKQELIVEDLRTNTFTTYKSNMDAFKVIGRVTMPSDYIDKDKIFRKHYKLRTK
jgi:hypothetical protein